MYNTDAFQMFSIYHYNIIGYLFAFGWFFIAFARKTDPKNEKVTRVVFAAIIPLLYITECAFAVILGYYSFYEFFPMHLCSIMVILAPAALLTKNQRLFEIVYLYGTFAAFAAVLFPALSRDNYYDLRISFFMLKHWLIVLSPMYLIFVHKFRPTFKGVLKSAVIAVLFTLLVVLPLDIILDWNYFYLLYGPAGTPLAAVEKAFGYGGYVVFLGSLAFVVPLVFYAPFVIFRKVKGKK